MEDHQRPQFSWVDIDWMKVIRRVWPLLTYISIVMYVQSSAGGWVRLIASILLIACLTFLSSFVFDDEDDY